MCSLRTFGRPKNPPNSEKNAKKRVKMKENWPFSHCLADFLSVPVQDMQGGQRRRRDKNSDTVTQRKSNPSAGSSQTNRFPQYAVLCQLFPPDVTLTRQVLPAVTFLTYLLSD